MGADFEALLASASTAIREGRTSDAEELCAAAVRLDPENVDARLLLGIMAIRSGKTELAVSSLERVLEAEPDNLEALNALAHLLRTKGQPAAALRCAQRAAELKPNDVLTQHNLGRCHLAMGELAEAEVHLVRAAAINPNMAAIHHDLATLRQRQGRIGEAAEELQGSIAVAPRDPEGHALLGQLFLNFWNVEGAIQSLRHAYELEPDTARGLTRLAYALSEAGQLDEAEEKARAALALAPKSSDVYALMGRVLQNNGRFEEAQEFLERAIEMEPDKLGPYYRLVFGRRITEADRDLIARMEGILTRRDLTDQERALIEYSLGKSYDDLGEYAAAAGHFEEANRLEFDRLGLTGRRYDAEAHRAVVDHTIATYTLELFETFRSSGSESELPVFIVGMERSGTSLVEQIVSSHSRVRGAGELAYWVRNGPAIEAAVLGSSGEGARAIRRFEGEYLRQLSSVGEADRVTDKMPGNIASLGQIHLVFPRAKIIWCLRDPIDNCLSIYFTAFRAGSVYLNNRGNIANAYRLHLALLEHWRRVLPGSNLLVVEYEELVSGPERVTREMISFLGLDWEEGCLRPDRNVRSVTTPSAWQTRQPIYRTSAGRWRHYEPWLGEFAELRS